MPTALLDKVEEAEQFGQGYATTSQVSATILDQGLVSAEA